MLRKGNLLQLNYPQKLQIYSSLYVSKIWDLGAGGVVKFCFLLRVRSKLQLLKLVTLQEKEEVR